MQIVFSWLFKYGRSHQALVCAYSGCHLINKFIHLKNDLHETNETEKTKARLCFHFFSNFHWTWRERKKMTYLCENVDTILLYRSFDQHTIYIIESICKQRSILSIENINSADSFLLIHFETGLLSPVFEIKKNIHTHTRATWIRVNVKKALLFQV